MRKTTDLPAIKNALNPGHYKHYYYTLLQFDKLPTPEEKKEMDSKGFRLFNYFPGNAFLAEIPDSFSSEDLGKWAISGMNYLPVSYKLIEVPKLMEASADPQQTIAVGHFGTTPDADVRKELENAGATILTTRIHPEHILFIKAAKGDLEKIASLPFVSFLAPQPMQSIPLNYNNRAAHGLDALSSPPGRNLLGQGVTIGIGDNSSPYTHVDFSGRLIDRFAAPVKGHGTHTSGTLAGGGILDPHNRGMAPRATLVSQYFTDILTNVPTYINDYDMVLTSNSYTNYNPGCINDGQYDALANFMDAQLLTYPTLLHDFAAGNDGLFTCSPFPYSFATIKSGFQCAKNVLTVGAFNNYSNSINVTSSVGPVNDGRLKPEIVAGGFNILSTLPNNNYGYSSGTSMACPTATGTLALLVQRYRQLHANADPTGALIKAIACNSATDIGNPGPDFVFGFGSLNARTAVETIEKNQFFTGTLANGANNSFTLSGVPAGLRQIKIMLYWPDAPAMPNAATTLVNNLDLTVTSPDAIIHHPLILNPDPAHVNDPATEGVDNLNNIEQVVINNPPGGAFTITVNGTSIPAGPQRYVVVYQLIPPSVTVEYPFGNETWVPGLPETIRWSAYGGDPNPFTIEYSPDNGNTWSTISNSAPSSSRLYNWTTPAAPTNQGLIRISRNGTPYSGISNYNFTILGQPVLTVTNPCQGYAQLNWNSIPGATGYEIMQLSRDTMATIATTGSTSLLLPNLSRDSTYWLAVRADNGAFQGRRSLAVPINPSGGACTLTALNNDLTIDSLIAPLNGRQFTSSQLSSITPVRVELKNLGTIPTSTPFSLSYQVNGGAIVTETVNPAIAAGGSYNYTFSQTYDYSATGTYNLQVWVNYPGDPQKGNDTLRSVVKQLANPALTLSPAFTEGFESAADITYTSPVAGFTGLDRCDFNVSGANGRVRTFLNSGFARTGNRSAILDQQHYSTSSTTDSLITTFNLSGYTSTDQLWLDFYYRNQGIDFSLSGNQVWIRGNDQATWIPVATLDSSRSNIGIYQPSTHIDITGTLASASPAQTVSSSFQIKFSEQGYTSANSVVTDGDLDNGYSFDDITLTHATNDIALRAMLTPRTTGICNLSNAETITVRVRNYSNTTATNIPVTYSVNGATVTETIPSINALDSIAFSFSHKADLSAFRNYTISAWVSYPGDTYRFNDTLSAVSFQTVPLISSFPYLEGFENSNGNWYTNGINDSWQWGAPAKTIINKAANGSKCWVTSLTGDYNNNELSYLYSPCFDLSSLTAPVLSFSHIFQTEDNCDCDYHWVEFSTDGITWSKLGSYGNGVHWFDDSARQSWQKSDTSWHVTSHDIPPGTGLMRFRFVMSSDPGTTYEGIGIDDVHIFDKFPIYKGADINSGLAQPVSGAGWINFDAGGARILSINPNGQDLGPTSVKIYIHPGSVRNDGRQYYGNRNIVIQPSSPPAGNVSVRYYFTDVEADSLIHGTGCGTCVKIADAYQSGIMQYSSPVLSEEDSTLSNDSSGTFHFLSPHRDVSIIPNDEGYYAEYQVNGFSEFWINSGTPGNNQPLPLALLSFTAARSGNDALLQWSTTGEKNTSRYIIEKSVDGSGFLAIDSVVAVGDSSSVNNYRYTDHHLWNGVNYYRLRMISTNRQFKYSPVRTVNDTLSSVVISVYPNPVHTGILYISTSSNCENIMLTDASGRVVLRETAHGFLNTVQLPGIARGIYFVRVQTGEGTKVIKVFIL